jgi:hypothetical protein
MKKIFPFLLILIGFACKSSGPIPPKLKQVNPSKVAIPSQEELPLMLLGRWEYQGSYLKDRIVVLEELGDLSRFYQFEPADTAEIVRLYPVYHRFASGKTLYGLQCQHESRPFGEITHPLVNSWTKDSSKVRIAHYEPGNGVGATYSYFIAGLNQDSLVIVNERRYDIDGKQYAGIRHFYKRAKPLPRD